MPIAVVLTFVVTTVTAVSNLKVKEQTLVTGLHGQTLGFAIVGLMDACYLFMLFAGAAHLPSWSLCVQLQTPVFLLLLGRVIFTSQPYRWLHYLGAVCLCAAVVADLQQSQATGQGTAALLVFFSFLPYTLSHMLKLAMLRTGPFCCFSFNKWTLFFTLLFGIGILLLIALIDTSDGGRWGEISGCASCLYGGEGCTLEPLWLLLFALATLLYQGVVYFAGRKEDYARLVSGFNVGLSLLAFVLAGWVLQEAGPELYEVVRSRQACVVVAVVGSGLYYFHQERPPKLCYSK